MCLAALGALNRRELARLVLVRTLRRVNSKARLLQRFDLAPALIVSGEPMGVW